VTTPTNLRLIIRLFLRPRPTFELSRVRSTWSSPMKFSSRGSYSCGSYSEYVRKLESAKRRGSPSKRQTIGVLASAHANNPMQDHICAWQEREQGNCSKAWAEHLLKKKYKEKLDTSLRNHLWLIGVGASIVYKVYFKMHKCWKKIMGVHLDILCSHTKFCKEMTFFMGYVKNTIFGDSK
jgi:hypothetical protein